DGVPFEVADGGVIETGENGVTRVRQRAAGDDEAALGIDVGGLLNEASHGFAFAATWGFIETIEEDQAFSSLELGAEEISADTPMEFVGFGSEEIVEPSGRVGGSTRIVASDVGDEFGDPKQER